MREKGGKQVGDRKKLKAERKILLTDELGERAYATLDLPILLYTYVSLSSQASFTPGNPRTIARLLSISFESLRETINMVLRIKIAYMYMT